ncbi:MFS transporter [Aspergillus aculeatinus CBS 121060]|uniref:MFS general substrate transporter n=1 Tax=Aspergillus aculeatinus CBS 121060 TaxID=1448322 RepID=A0ACD1GV46_9EURO|nr:MFS general substrate transporter [Aspergillus aculeatinus CBS 121060]RAH65212.1 MFS general substrate transporter [Aspergillus aculeatinus CBS 121060]
MRGDTDGNRSSRVTSSPFTEQGHQCPQPISEWHKWAIVWIVCTGSMCVTCTSSIYTTTYTQMNAELTTTSFISTLGLSSSVLGIALGPLLTGPLSEAYGRRPIYLISWSLFIVWMIPSVVTIHMALIIVSRFVQGLAGGTFLAVAGGTVRDLFSPNEIQKPMVIAAWTYYVVLIWSLLLLIAIIVSAPETNSLVKPRNKRAKPDSNLGNKRPTAQLGTAPRSTGRLLVQSLVRPFQLLFFEPMCLCLDVYSAILLGILYLFFGAFPLVFRTMHAMKLWQIGLTFLGIITGMLMGAASNPLWIKIRERLIQRHHEGGSSEPEYRLPPAILGGILIPAGLFWFGWTIYPSVHWILPIMGSAVFGCGVVFAFIGIFKFLVDAYPQYAASALAANGFARCSFAAAFPLFGVQMYEKLGYQWATSPLAFLTVLMMPLPWLFFKHGEMLRKNSRFATVKEERQRIVVLETDGKQGLA